MTTKILILFLTLVPLAAAGPVQLTLAFSNAAPIAIAGSTVDFTAVISNPVANGVTLFLNGDTLNVPAPLTGDDSFFLVNTPVSLDAGTDSGSTPLLLFRILVPAGTPAAVYSGSLTVIGGLDGSDQQVLASGAWQVTVPGGAVPEPATSVLALAGGALLLAVRYRSSLRRP